MVVGFLKPFARWRQREEWVYLLSWLRECEQRFWELELEYCASANLMSDRQKILVIRNPRPFLSNEILTWRKCTKTCIGVVGAY